MLLRFIDEHRHGDLRVEVRDPTSTVGDLAEALGVAPARPLYLDGQAIDRSQPLMRLPVPDGAVLSPAPPAGAAIPSGVVVKVSEGLDAGQVASLSNGAVQIGRAPDNHLVVRDATMSQHHCAVGTNGNQIALVDHSSRNGTRLDGRLLTNGAVPVTVDPRQRITSGNTGLRIADWSTQDRPTAIGTRPVVDGGRVFHRQPPSWPSRRRHALVVPQPPSVPTKPFFTVTALLMPILMGGGFFLFMLKSNPGDKNAYFMLLFMGMSPLMMVGNMFEQRMRGRRRFGADSRGYREELAAFSADLTQECAEESAYRTEAHPDLAELVRWATLPSARLWERRPDHPSFADLVIGTGDLPWCPPLEGNDPVDEVADAIEAIGHLYAVPVIFDAEPGKVVGLTGPRSHALAVARSMLIQAAAAHGPADLSIAVVVNRAFAAEWDWVKWLPHTATGSGVRMVACSDDAGARVAKAIAAESGDRRTIVLLDAGDDADLGNRWARDLFDGSLPVAGIVVASSRGALPPSCDPVVDWDHTTQSLVIKPKVGRPTIAAPLGLRRTVAESCARSMAPLRDPFQNAGTSTIPRRCALLDTLGDGSRLTDAVRERWIRQRGRSALVVALGVGTAGEVTVDLRGETGVAILGAQGSGRTECLRVLVTGAASAADPNHLKIVLIGKPLSACEPLPHVVATLDESDAASLTLVCDSIERLVAERRRAGGNESTTVLVAIDDLQTLVALQGTQADRLLKLSRATGDAVVRIVAASSRPSGGLNWLGEARATRVALRTDSTSDAREWINDVAPAAFGRDRPGAAMVAAPSTSTMHVQIATLAYDSREGSDPFVVERFDLVSAGPGHRAEPAANGRDLQRLVAAIADAARAEGYARTTFVGSGDDRVVEAPALDLGALLGIDVGTLDPATCWAPRDRHDFLRAPIGTDLTGGVVSLDIKEPAHEGMGPHGLVVGATGSGKSELLRTLLMSLAVTHGPDDLSLVLVDFKGGATFRGMAGLPHLSGLVTNLTGEAALVDRIREAIKGELDRRQQLLHDTNADSITDYALLRADNPEFAPLPHLFIVIDEFVELLTEEPSFIDVFLQIGRVGRSVGVHLLLASQQLEEGKIRGLERNLRYRIALRTETQAESRAALGLPDAAALPSDPGSGFLKVDIAPLQRFRAAFASGPYRGDSDTGNAPSTMAVIVKRLAASTVRARQIWLPALGDMIPLTRLLTDWAETPELGLRSGTWSRPGSLTVPIGVEDRPREQCQVAHLLNLEGTHGNLAVVGSAQTGKSTTLRTLALALASTHTPSEVQIYAVDLGGGTLHQLAPLPHVGAVAGAGEHELTRRIIGHLESIVAEREERFRRLGIDSMASLRSMRAEGLVPDEIYGDVFLFIDGWAKFRNDYDAYEQSITDLAARGLGYGVHVVLTANRWAELKAALADHLGGRIELKLNTHTDSAIGSKESAAIPKDLPGRALTRDRRYMQIAAPRLDDGVERENFAEAAERSVAAIADAWTGESAPPVRTLPTDLRPADLHLVEPEPPGVAIGLSELTMGPEYLDLVNAEPHFLVYGDNEAGKSTFLRTVVRGLVRRTKPEDTAIYVLDVRRALLEVVPRAYLRSYMPSVMAAGDVFTALRSELEQRLPGSDVTAAELRARSWWTGPEIYLVVDDYDILTGNPLAPLIDFFAQGRDIGFHVLIARRVSGASGAAFDPAIKRLREVSPSGLLLSGDRSEGALLGSHRAGPQPAGRGLLVRPRAAATTLQVLVDEGAGIETEH